jgi:hypothetical protein
MATRNLPDDPHLDHLRKQAKTLLKQVRADDPDAVALAAEFHPVRTLAEAQLVVARSYGFPSWPRIVRHLELIGRYSRSPHRQPVGADLVEPTSSSGWRHCTTGRTIRLGNDRLASCSTGSRRLP